MSHSEAKVVWHSVKDVVPVLEEGILCRSAVVLMLCSEGMRTGFYAEPEASEPGVWCYTGPDSYKAEPTHWAELPPPPGLSKMLPDRVGLWWVMSKLFERKFPGMGEAYDFMKKLMMEEAWATTAPIVGGDGVEVKQPMMSPPWILSHFAGMRYPDAGQAAERLFEAYQAGLRGEDTSERM